jgi:hypothetical protein
VLKKPLTKKRVPGTRTQPSEQIQLQLRAYLIAEGRKNLGVGWGETADWAQAERALRAEALAK